MNKVEEKKYDEESYYAYFSFGNRSYGASVRETKKGEYYLVLMEKVIKPLEAKKIESKKFSIRIYEENLSDFETLLYKSISELKKVILKRDKKLESELLG